MNHPPEFGEHPAPLSPHQAYLPDLIKMRDDLGLRELYARVVAQNEAAGKARDPKAPEPEPLSVHEHLVLIAVEESIRKHIGDSAIPIQYARRAGATWEQIAAALDCRPDDARGILLRFIQGQEHLWDTYVSDTGMRFGLAPEERAEVRALLGDDDETRA